MIPVVDVFCPAKYFRVSTQFVSQKDDVERGNPALDRWGIAHINNHQSEQKVQETRQTLSGSMTPALQFQRALREH
jgi:hypothetical protein